MCVMVCSGVKRGIRLTDAYGNGIWKPLFPLILVCVHYMKSLPDDNEMCIFRKSFLDNRTTFKHYNKWSQSHPLYPCAFLCQGKDVFCHGYRPLKKYSIGGLDGVTPNPKHNNQEQD